jgi:hypothetical protein
MPIDSTTAATSVWRRRSKLELTILERALAAAASLQGRLRANNWRGGGGRKARNTGARKRNLSITITRNQSSTVWEARNGNFIITVGRQGSSSMGRRLRGGSAMQTRNVTIV